MFGELLGILLEDLVDDLRDVCARCWEPLKRGQFRYCLECRDGALWPNWFAPEPTGQLTLL